MIIPSYKDALENHATPLDVFVARWQPVDRTTFKNFFRQDLEALIGYLLSEPRCPVCHEVMFDDDGQYSCNNESCAKHS